MTLTFVSKGVKQPVFCMMGFPDLQELHQVADAARHGCFFRGRCIQDAVDKGVRGNVVPRPALDGLVPPEAGPSGEPGSPHPLCRFSFSWREPGSPQGRKA